ncbi:hypothetical protein [Streptomyces winkii]|uniref:hypothetical protein n=1 Tax=Streptomyces winkii TaxID=3051178 RepID=UPI0028D23AA7|nr:hypothetical protein [Streptomyces sp. DSM 40971]
MGSVLVSAVAALVYSGTVSFLAFTATFARRGELRREARSTLALVVPGRTAEPQQSPTQQP